VVGIVAEEDVVGARKSPTPGLVVAAAHADERLAVANSERNMLIGFCDAKNARRKSIYIIPL
jgi:hypothetical protein